MNRIYQGRVTRVEILNADKNVPAERRWQPLVDWETKLWQHHELFQDAVNYYTLALAALAEGLSPATPQGAAALAWREQVRDNWIDGRRKAVPYDGPHRRIAPLLGVEATIVDEHAAFEACAKAIVRSNGSSTGQRAAALMQLLEEAEASDLNQLCVNRLRWFCTRKGALDATPRNVIAQQEIERIRQTKAVWAADTKGLVDAAAALQPGRFVTQMPDEFSSGAEACVEAIKQYRAAAKKAAGLAEHEAEFCAHLGSRGEALRVPRLGRKPSGVYPFALVLHLWPSLPAWEAFKHATRNLVEKEAPVVATDAIAEARNSDEPLFDYFTNRVLYREAVNTTHAVWFEFDLAAFIEAIKSPHRFYQDTQRRATEAHGIREHLHAIEPDRGWLESVPASAEKKPAKMSSTSDEDDGGAPGFTFAGDPRAQKLRALLTEPDKLASLAEAEEGETGEFMIRERTLRGWSEIREAWRKRAARGPCTPEVLWSDVAAVQGEHRDDFGSAILFEALARAENHSIWQDAPPEPDRHAQDVLRAWKDYKELVLELKDRERPIRFTPAHAEKSPRYFIVPKTGRFGTDHERAAPADVKLRFTAGIVVETARGIEAVPARFEYAAPRLRRDRLRTPGEEDLESVSWIQPMTAALGVPETDKQDFSKCRVTLQPTGPKDHQLTFPVEVDSSALQKALGGGRWARQFNVHPEGERFYNASLRWPHEKTPAKPPVPWWNARSAFTVLAVDLGQRDAGAYALLEIRGDDTFGDRPARLIGETGEGADRKIWRAAPVAMGLMRLSGEDKVEWRSATKTEEAQGMSGFDWREELYGERGRSATPAETEECLVILEALGIPEAGVMSPGWRDLLSFPEQNSKLLVAARRAQSRMARLHRWAWFLADAKVADRIKVARDEIADVRTDAEGRPDPRHAVLATLANGDLATLQSAVRDELLRAQTTMPEVLVQIANRVLPLRGRSWRWRGNEDFPGCHLLEMSGPDRGRVWLRGQRGLSLERIEQIEELRRRVQSLNQSLRRQIGARAKPRRDETVPDPCEDLLEKLDRQKKQRVNQTAHMILAQALGVRLRPPSAEKSRLRIECDQHGEYERFRAAADFIVIEDLSRYRASQGRAPRENSRLMKWCHRAIRNKLREMCEPFGLPVVETVAAWSSRFCARTGVPGFRAAEVASGFTREGHWAWLAGKKDKDGKPTEEAQWLTTLARQLDDTQRGLEQAWVDKKRPGRCPQRALLVPATGGPIFVPLCDAIAEPEDLKLQPKIVQADINAALNLALRAVADPRRWNVHPRLRTQPEGGGRLLAKEKRKYGPKKSVVIVPVGDTKLAEETGRSPNLFFDRSGEIAWGHAEVPDPIDAQPVRVVLGAAMWKTVREAQWRRCAQINAARLAKWRREQPVPGQPEL